MGYCPTSSIAAKSAATHPSVVWFGVRSGQYALRYWAAHDEADASFGILVHVSASKPKHGVFTRNFRLSLQGVVPNDRSLSRTRWW